MTLLKNSLQELSSRTLSRNSFRESSSRTLFENPLQGLSSRTLFQNSLQELSSGTLFKKLQKPKDKISKAERYEPRRQIQTWAGRTTTTNKKEPVGTKDKRYGGGELICELERHRIGNRASVARTHARTKRNDFPVWGSWPALSPPNLRYIHIYIYIYGIYIYVSDGPLSKGATRLRGMV